MNHIPRLEFILLLLLFPCDCPFFSPIVPKLSDFVTLHHNTTTGTSFYIDKCDI